jgi:hypothetical protein
MCCGPVPCSRRTITETFILVSGKEYVFPGHTEIRVRCQYTVHALSSNAKVTEFSVAVTVNYQHK